MTPWISWPVERLLDWLVPKDCLGCSVQLAADDEWCAICAEKLEPNPAVQVSDLPLVAPYRHTGPLRRAIHRLKYESRSDYASRLVASGFSPSLPEQLRGVSLVPVPLHPLRLAERGYNQSALLASALGQRWRLPVAFDLLHRHRFTLSQVGRGREQRAENVDRAFSVPRRRIPVQMVWLVDDVVTTGATAFGCRAALEAANVQVLGIVALTHARSTEAG
jgi:ComF family protein